MKSQATGIAVWGIGQHARKTVLPAIAECGSLKLIGIGTRDETVRGQQANLYQCHAWSSLDEILACPEVEVVYLATPIGLHYDEGVRVLNSGRHLWCEKSLTSSLAEAEELYGISKVGDLSLCVVCGPLYHPQFSKIVELIQQGAIGKVQCVTGVFEFPHVSAHKSRYDPETGGSALLDLGFYPVVVLNELADGEVMSVSAKLEREQGYAIDTAGEAVLTTVSGLRLKACWGYGRDYRNEMIIQGERGSLHVSPAFSKPKGRDFSIGLKIDEKQISIAVSPENQFLTMLQSFSNAINNAGERTRQRGWAVQTQRLLDRIISGAA